MLSVAYFYKDIESYIQRITEQVPYRELGLPDSLLDGTPASPTDIFTVGRFANTPGGPLEGFEINAQVQFSFLPGFWSNFGVLANYTEVDAEIEYFISADQRSGDQSAGRHVTDHRGRHVVLRERQVQHPHHGLVS